MFDIYRIENIQLNFYFFFLKFRQIWLLAVVVWWGNISELNSCFWYSYLYVKRCFFSAGGNADGRIRTGDHAIQHSHLIHSAMPPQSNSFYRHYSCTSLFDVEKSFNFFSASHVYLLSFFFSLLCSSTVVQGIGIIRVARTGNVNQRKRTTRIIHSCRLYLHFSTKLSKTQVWSNKIIVK